MALHYTYLEDYQKAARQAVAEGQVLLKNDGALPLEKGARIAMFGRIQYTYYKSGTGSGGKVHAPYVIGIRDAFEVNGGYTLDSELDACYRAWIEEHPFDPGVGWASEPWYQEEMPLTDAQVKEAAERNDAAIVVIGRQAGEDRDNIMKEGGWYLTRAEETLLQQVTSAFKKSVVILNTGSILDMNWVEKYDPSAVLYAWQGGQEGGNGTFDVLTGAVSPSGRLSDTIPKNIAKHPSMTNFGGVRRTVYEEDIYVGYRYFESFGREGVLYPFGYGLSYTTFEMSCVSLADLGDHAQLTVCVKNTGNTAGKETVMAYVAAPQGKLGKAAKSLAGFAKTGCLAPGAEETLTLELPWYLMASYDDSGVTGHRYAYVLEEGAYEFFIGNDVSKTVSAGCIEKEAAVIQQLESAMAPSQPFLRVKNENGRPAREEAPLAQYDKEARRLAARPEEIPYTGDRGIKLRDVVEGKAALDDFIAQLPKEDLLAIVRGEGPESEKVPAKGCIGSFGGVTKSLRAFGVPIATVADGPSGIRRDNGVSSFSLPNGTCIACSFNCELAEELFTYEGKELHDNRIESLLGPGMNVHRNPLNGRNFEYFSEDPVLGGKLAAAMLRGMHKGGATGTIKHFCCNNQEAWRYTAEAIVSERALREIYLKPFEIAVKEGSGDLVMTTYGPVNDFWTGANFDLCSVILRDEWGFEGVVMSDWWAVGNDFGEEGTSANTASMVRAQNDVYMLMEDAEANSAPDNSEEELAKGTVTLAEYQRCAANILKWIMKTQCMRREMGIEDPSEGYADTEEPLDDSQKQH